ncbi:unnamed protein product, partial [Brenthis ino]
MFIINLRRLRYLTICTGFGSCSISGYEHLTAPWNIRMDGLAEKQMHLTILQSARKPTEIAYASNSMLRTTS